MSNIVIKRKWDFGFEADAAQRTFASELAPFKEKLLHELSVFEQTLPRQRRSRQRFSDAVRAGAEVEIGRPTLDDLRRENAEQDRRRDDCHGRQP